MNLETSLRRMFPILLLGSLLLPAMAQDSNPWGLRNFRLLNQGITPSDFYNHGAGYNHGFILWNEIQPYPPPAEPQWVTLNESIFHAVEMEAVPVIVLFMNADWVTDCPEQDCSNLNTGPHDLTTNAHPDHLFSEILYDTTKAMVHQIATQYTSGDLFLRFHNEPFTEWDIGALEDWDTNIENYERCLRTFRKAARDAAEDYPGLNVMTSHGGQPRFRQFTKYLYEWGTSGGPSVQDEALNWANFLRERIEPGSGEPYPDWPTFEVSADPKEEKNAKEDRWLSYHYRWANETPTKGILDFEDMHPHGKPASVLADRIIYRDEVIASAQSGETPNPLPVFAVEAAIEVEPEWELKGDQLFQAEDFVRKWATLIAAGDIGFCTPVIGTPSDEFLGLTDETEFFEANKSFKFLAKKLRPTNAWAVHGGSAQQSMDELLQELPGLTHYHFVNDPSLDTRVDIVWNMTTRDADHGTTTATIDRPHPSYNFVRVFSAVGVKEASMPAPPQLTLTSLGQAPKIVIWGRAQGVTPGG